MNTDQELRYWRALALYLADCHAATAESFCDMKSTSKYNRQRLRRICEIANDAITTGASDAPLSQYWNDGTGRTEQVVSERLTAATEAA